MEAIRVFKEVKHPDEVNVILVFNACAQLGTPEALTVVKAISASIPKSFSSNPRINNSLLDALIKCGSLVSAEKLFTTIDRSAISYGNLMSGYNKVNQSTKTVDLFHQMEKESLDQTLSFSCWSSQRYLDCGAAPLLEVLSIEFPSPF